MQSLYIVQSTGKNYKRSRAPSVFVNRIASDIKAVGRSEKRISRTNRNSKEVSRRRKAT